MTFSPGPQDTWQGPRVRMRNLSAFKIIGAIGSERRAKGGALFHISMYLRCGIHLNDSDFHEKGQLSQKLLVRQNLPNSSAVTRKTGKHLMTGKRRKTPESAGKRRKTPNICTKTLRRGICSILMPS